RALGVSPALTDSTFWSTKERPASSSGRAGRHRSGLCEVAQRTERHTETETPVLRPVPNGPGGEDDSGVEQAVNGAGASDHDLDQDLGSVTIDPEVGAHADGDESLPRAQPAERPGLTPPGRRGGSGRLI